MYCLDYIQSMHQQSANHKYTIIKIIEKKEPESKFWWTRFHKGMTSNLNKRTLRNQRKQKELPTNARKCMNFLNELIVQRILSFFPMHSHENIKFICAKSV